MKKTYLVFVNLYAADIRKSAPGVSFGFDNNPIISGAEMYKFHRYTKVKTKNRVRI
jgi:hypothetical protein